MAKRLALPFIVLTAALLFDYSAAIAQTRSGGNWGGRSNNPAQAANPFNGSQTQQAQPPNVYQQPQEYSNGYQGRQSAQGYSNGYQGWQTPRGYGAYDYARGRSDAGPGYGAYGPRYGGWQERRARREHMWRERMWREHARYRRGWDW